MAVIPHTGWQGDDGIDAADGKIPNLSNSPYAYFDSRARREHESDARSQKVYARNSTNSTLCQYVGDYIAVQVIGETSVHQDSSDQAVVVQCCYRLGHVKWYQYLRRILDRSTGRGLFSEKSDHCTGCFDQCVGSRNYAVVAAISAPSQTCCHCGRYIGGAGDSGPWPRINLILISK
jgi:hypothetical protein